MDTGTAGLIVRAGANSAVQVVGTDNTGAEGDVVFYKNASVMGNLNGKFFKVKAVSGGGNIRSIPLTDETESSIGFYKYTDERAINPGDLWVAGDVVGAGLVIQSGLLDWIPAYIYILNVIQYADTT